MSRFPSAAYAILSGATSTGAGNSFTPWGPYRSFHIYGSTSSGAGSATVDIEVSNDASSWVVGVSCDLTLSTTVTAHGKVFLGHWKYVRANVTAISGAGASVSVILGTGQ